MKVEIDRARCASSGMCAANAASVFAQDDDTGVVILLDEHPDPSLYESVKSAEKLCPTRAITV